MATRKVYIELDETLVIRARDRVSGAARDDSGVIADAVTAFLGFSALDEVHAEGGLPEAEADALAVDEVRAHRAARSSAA